MKKVVCAVSSVLIAVFSASADMIYQFENITNNSASNAAIGELQLSMKVSDDIANKQVIFTFINTGTEASSICDIYFDDNPPAELVFQGFRYPTSGVTFTIGAHPSDLPGGQDYAFTSDYSYDSKNPVQSNGINPGESLSLVFNYTNGNDYSSIVSAINSSNIDVGIHVQGFSDGGSESFINSVPVPEPAPLGFLITGILCLGASSGIRRRKK
jgi:hypothetical protein